MNSLTAASDPTGALKAGYQTLINQAKSDEAQNPLTKAQLTRSVYEMGLQEDESAFGLSLAGRQGQLQRGLLAGQSYDQLAGDEHGILSAETARSAQIRRSAENPINSPAERDRMLAQATEIETGAAQQQYQFRMAGYGQKLAGDDERIGAGALAVTQAQINQGPEGVFAARGQEVEAFQAKIGELSRELERGGLTVDDRIQKEKDLNTTRGQEAQAAFTRNEGRFNDTFALDSTLTETAQIGLGRRIGRAGNAGAGEQALSLSLTDRTDAQNHLDYDRAHYAGNRQLIAEDEGRVARTQEAREQLLDETNAYRPSGAQSRQREDAGRRFRSPCSRLTSAAGRTRTR